MKYLLSLFDASGHWPSEFFYKGWDVSMLDLSSGQDINDYQDVENVLDRYCHIDGIVAAVPCDDFALCGSRWWQRKDETGQTEASMELVYQTLRFVDLFRPTDPDYYREGGTFFWTIENPVGRIQKLFPELGPAYYFQPCDFAGHLDLTESDHNELDRLRRKDGHGVTAEEREFILSCNAYNKKTGLWGEFNPNLVKKPIEPVKCNAQGSPVMSLGGKGKQTKALRSITPIGFAKAFYQSNFDYTPSYSCPIQLDLFYD